MSLGICFKEPLFNAVVNGTKTQTRRIVNDKTLEKLNEYWSWYEFAFSQPINGVSVEPDETNSFAKYKFGETVYLKEPYTVIDDVVFYKYGIEKDISGTDKWENKLFMPEKYARYFIEITGVRCERLQEISDENCFREGIWEAENIGLPGVSYWYGGCVNSNHRTPQEAYTALIDKINGKGTWESNPYVFVYDFKLLKDK